MITFAPFWDMVGNKGISTYQLEKTYGLSKSLIHRLRTNRNVTLKTVDDICKTFQCSVKDVVVYIEIEG